MFDVYSLNNYAYTVNQRGDRQGAQPDRPADSDRRIPFRHAGPRHDSGARQTSSQEERGVAYRYYVENAVADPSIVGTHWFEWIDEPSTGRFDGENYNIGLVDVTDRPYRELLDAAAGDAPAPAERARRKRGAGHASGQGGVGRTSR